jgi:SAM-dependent methyltransferase
MVFPESVDGWLTRAEGQCLSERSRGRRVLEVGSWCGRSTICLAQTARVVHAVDWHRGDGATGFRLTLPVFLENLARFGVADRVIPHVARIELLAGLFAASSFDLVFIDSCHDREAVETAIRICQPWLRPDGIWAFHDYANAAYPAVRTAVDWLLRPPAHALEMVDSLAVFPNRASSCRFSIVVPTTGRLSLQATLASIRLQTLVEGDEILVVGDGDQPAARRIWNDAGLPGRYIELATGPTGDWGMAARNRGMAGATGDFLLFMDDDDVYLAGAWEAIRRAVAAQADRLHLFRMLRAPQCDYVWSERDLLACGNVSTQIFVVPNDPTRLGRWGAGYTGDFDFISSTAAHWPPGALMWHDQTVCVWRPAQ